jgi:pSer/pThr/pTyr-binding forkhead associated (FHA) protein
MHSTDIELRAVSGPAAGSVIGLHGAHELLLGRDLPGLGAVASDPSISRRHARLTSGGGGEVIIEDLGSTNGTFVNGHRLTGPVQLRAGDVVQLGTTTAEVVDGAAPGRPEPVRTTAPTTTVASGPTPNRRWSDGLLGTARNVTERTVVSGNAGGPYGQGGVSSQTTVRFRLEPAGGGRPVHVRLKGTYLDGAIGDGELVEVRGRWRGGELRAREVYSHTTGDTLRQKYRILTAITGVVAVAFLLAIALLVYLLVTGDGDPAARFDELLEGWQS